MDWMQNRALTLASLMGGALALLAAWQMGQPILALAAALFFTTSILIWKWGYFLGPMLTHATKTALAGDHYELIPSQDVLIKKGSQGYVATMFLSIQLRESASGKTEQHQALLMELFERAVSSLRYVVKLSVLVCNLDLSDYVDKLQERRSLAEHKKAQLRGKHQQDEAARLEREIETYTQQIRRLSGGERPMQVLAYASTTARGLTREEVIARVRTQAQESSAVLSNALACEVRPLAGSQLLHAFEWEKWAPSSREELEDALF